MHGSLSSRVKALKDQVGWMRMVLLDRDGKQVLLPTVPIVDAYLHAMVNDGDMEGAGLEPSLVLALADVPVRASMSDMEAMVVRGARRLLDTPTGVPASSPDNPMEGEVVA
jgi:hypothetical protein